MTFAYRATRVGVVALALAGCTGSAGGYPDGGAPSYDERVALYATNRARVAPMLEGYPLYRAAPPLQWNEALGRVARAHALDMRDTPCFQHASCNGADAFTRIKRAYTGPWTDMAENISSGVIDGRMVVTNWLGEIGAPSGETGDRDHIFSPDFTLVGLGFAAGGRSRQNLWTQDFVGTPIERAAMADGIHVPAAPGPNARVTFGVTYYADAPPSQVLLVVQQVCHALSLSRGTRDKGAYESGFTLGPMGCFPYYFVAEGVTYPATGSLQVGVGGTSCDLVVATRVEPDGGLETCTPAVDGGATDGPAAGG